MATNDSLDPDAGGPSQQGSETNQILTANNPDAQPKPPIDPKWRPYYHRLLQLRDRMIDSHTDLSAKAQEIQAEAVKQEPAEIGTNEFQRDYALAMMTNEQEMLYEIEAALQRIEAGTYGICEVTGKRIPAERLDAVPWTRCTVEGQRQLEQAGGSVKPSLGAIEADRVGSPEEREHVNVPGEGRPLTAEGVGPRVRRGGISASLPLRPVPGMRTAGIGLLFLLGFALGRRRWSN